MPVNTFRQAVRVFVDTQLGADAQHARFVEAARAGRDALIASGRATPTYTTFADGVQGASEESARSVIAYRYEYLADAVAFALGFLRARSPVSSGRFQASFIVAVDGTPLAQGAVTRDAIGAATEVMIYSPLPYARRVDVQFDGRRRLRFEVPAGLFDDAVAAVRGRFGNTLTAKRLQTVNFPGQYVRKRGADRGRLVEAPALLLTPGYL